MEKDKSISTKKSHMPSPFGFFDDAFDSLVNWPSQLHSSGVNISESENGYVVAADIPGIPKEDIQVNVKGNRLTISAEHDESSDDKDGYSRQYRSFHQSFTLPADIEADQIEAHCENGCLEVWVPKTMSGARRKVEVQSGKKGFLDRFKGKLKKSEAEKH
ncbi:MAG: Hsp20/alpha crystallin family protein [Bdellovibrionota bacterium]